MKPFIAFTKKEFTEGVRTCRLVVLIAVMALLGLMSPLFAKLMPELLSGADLGGGIVITAPEPAAMDSWVQFFGNVGQMGMLTLIIVTSGTMAGELSRGTLVNLLTKGMRRGTVILSKFTASAIMWTFGYLLCLGVCYAYTEYFWPGAELANALLAFASPWLFGMFLIALLIFGGTLFANFYGSLSLCLGVIIVSSVLNIAPAIQPYNPLSLAGGTCALLNGGAEPSGFFPAVIICAALTAALLAASVAVFNRKKV